MSRFTVHGHDLFDGHDRRIATVSGLALYDANNQRVASIHGNELLDADRRIMAVFRGSDIYDYRSEKVGSIADVKSSIKGAAEEMIYVAMWYCFVR